MQTICSESLGVEVQTGNNLFEVKGFSNSGLILSDFKWYFLLNISEHHNKDVYFWPWYISGYIQYIRAS